MKSKFTHRIVVRSEEYPNELGVVETHYTSTIWYRKKILWSSTSQLYSRRIDAVNAAKKFLAAVKLGKVEVVS